MKHLFTALIAVVALAFLAAPALADWDPGDDHKMHFPQLPDRQGWDVAFIDYTAGNYTLADDFKCTSTGRIDDIHFWMSFQGEDWSGNPQDVGPITAGIWSNNPVGPENFSVPEHLLWERVFRPGEFTFRQDGEGPQGFFNPATGQFVKPDHNLFYQINITKIADPFVQQEGQIYWLSLEMDMQTYAMPGWKTSTTQWEDDAVWRSRDTALPWQEVRDPITGESLDLAFVITPEPGTVAMLIGAGLIGLVAFARRRRKS